MEDSTFCNISPALMRVDCNFGVACPTTPSGGDRADSRRAQGGEQQCQSV